MTAAWNFRAAGAAVIALFAAIIAELCWGTVGGNVPPLSPINVTLPKKVAPAFPENAVESILARPLFVPGRRRMNSGDMAGRIDESVPRLAGIVLAPDRKVAIFQVNGEKPKSLSEGDMIGIWTVKKIDHQSVVMQNSGGTMTLAPAKDANAAGPSGGIPQQGGAFSPPPHRRVPPAPPSTPPSSSNAVGRP